MAEAQVNLSWSLPSISTALGIDHQATGIIRNNIWVVPGVDQPALDAAIAAYDDGAEKLAIQWAIVRADRNQRLAECDWTQLPDSPLADAEKSAWATYRAALRDVPAQGDPYAIAWPVAP